MANKPKLFFISLDIFKEHLHNKGIQNKLDGWLTFLGSDSPEDILTLLERFPEFKPLYEHVYRICRNMEDIMGIFSKELEDASKLDGCNVFQTFYKIALPCALPAIATLGIFTFVTSWNSFMWPLIVTNTESMRTLAVGLTIFKNSFREITLWGELMACSCICSIPAILIFITGKKYLINNPSSGALKE